MADPTPGTADWLAQHTEPIIDADRRIIDPHHHLWREERRGRVYVLEDLWKDTTSGHNIEKTVFVECTADYRTDGPDSLKPVGETVFVAEQAAESSKDPNQATIAAIVSHADLTLGDAVEEVLQAHAEAGQGLFRGIRHSGACDPHPEDLRIPGQAPQGLFEDANYRTGMNVLGRLGMTFDSWHYHHQNLDFAALAAACPETQIIIDHFGTPIGVGVYAGKRDEIFAQWKKDIAEIAKCDNVVAKIGGLAMPDNGYGWDKRATPATSDELVASQRDYYLHAIECFGPDRCLMESNFPVDKFSISYPVLYNALKKIVADFSEDEKDAMFYGNAARVYSIA